MKLCRILSRLALIGSLFMLPSYSTASAMSLTQISGGQSCRKVGEVSGTLTKSFICTKVGRKFVWRKVVVQVNTTTTSTLPPVSMATQVPDLQAFIDKYAQSVVTVSCNGSQGSGVSVSVNQDALKARGYQSYIITNEHVIYDCIVVGASQQQVTITHKGIEYVGYLASYPSWNDVNAGIQPDLAAIQTTALVPPMGYNNVKQPALGHAVVAVGSAGGVPGVTTRGEVAGVSAKKIVTSAPAGHGSSGGAVFNNLGQLLGFITAANASLVEVTPITDMCSWVIACGADPIVYVP